MVSDAIRERLISHGVPESKIRVIENGVDTDRFRPDSERAALVRAELGIPERAKVVGIVGRMVPLKNHDIFIRALKMVSRSESDVWGLVVGDGPLKDRLLSLAGVEGLSERVVFTGWRTDMERVLAAVDILVLCSQVEGHNVVILEAMACEKPVVGTDVYGINSVIKNGRNGLLVPPGNPERLAEAVLTIIRDPSKGAAMGKKARRCIERDYSVEKMLSSYTKIFGEIGG